MDFVDKIKIGIPGLLFLLVMGVFIISGFVVNIEPGYEGVLIDKTAGGVQDIALNPGWHFKTPIIQSIEKIEIRTQKEEVPADASSKDLQMVATKIALNYHPAKGTTPKLYSTLGTDYKTRLIDPVIQESVKAVTAKYTAEELVTKREEVKGQISLDIKQKLTNNNIIVEDIFITNFNFSEAFTNSIESKQIAEQNALKAKNDLARIKIEAEQRIASAQAEAEALRITGEALKDNPDLIELEKTKKWDGRNPLYVGSGAESMMISVSS